MTNDQSSSTNQAQQNLEFYKDEIESIKAQLDTIYQRNLTVEKNKAWETSKTRIAAVCTITWLLISLVFWIIGVERHFINAIIPTIGFFLSTQSLPFLKEFWVEKFYNKH